MIKSVSMTRKKTSKKADKKSAVKKGSSKKAAEKKEAVKLEDSKLTWLPGKTFELEFTVPWTRVKKAYDKSLEEVVKQAEIKGFRKGKAPKKVVEQNIDKQRLYEEAIKKLLPETYQKAVSKHNLNPIISPKVETISLKEHQDWTFKATACEAPEVKLEDYEKAVKGELAKDNIWTPGKEKPDKGKEKQKPTDDQKIRVATKTLLDTAEVKLADLLIEEETSRMLSRLLDQVNSLGLTIDQYVKNKGITQQQLRESYKKQAEQTLKLEFILQEIVKEKNIKVTDEEVKKMITATPDEETRKKLQTPMQKAYITSVLAKRKAIDYLINL
jgi:FKBP-type peptidyl-prolyl cis-trans isomerase (trigger factor)